VPYFKNFIECDLASMPAFDLDAVPDSTMSEAGTTDSFSASIVFTTAWADRVAFATRIMGYARGTTLYVPHRYPNCLAAIAVSIDMKGMGAPTKVGYMVTYERARITVNYKTMPFETRIGTVNEPFILETLEGNAEFLTIPADNLYWEYTTQPDGSFVLSVPLADTEAPGKLQKSYTWVYTMVMLPEVPPNITALIGCVNSKAVMSKRFGRIFPAGTLLWGVPAIRAVSTVFGDPAFEAALNLSYSSRGWNNFLRKGGKVAQPIWSYNDVERPPNSKKYVSVAGEFNAYPLARFNEYLTEA